MPLKKWIKLSEKVAAENPWWKSKVDEYELPSGRHVEFYYLSDNGGVMMVGLTDDGKMPLVRQYRPMMDAIVLEFPAGGLDVGESDEDGARRELEEETGFKAKTMEFVNYFFPTPGRSNQRGRIFIATGLTHGQSKLDDAEELELVLVTPEEFDAMVERGKIHDGWGLSSWFMCRKRIYELRDAQLAKK